MAAVPSVMRFIRAEMRGHRRAEVSVPQFRCLIFVSLNDRATVSALADHLGLSLPAASRMVQLLVRRGLMERRERRDDRRRASLSLTRQGRVVFESAFQATQTALAERFKSLTPGKLGVVNEAMRILNIVFQQDNGHQQDRG